MKNRHLKAAIMLLVILVAGACSNRVDRTISEIHSLLDSLQSEYAPDTRIALWDITVTGAKDLITLSGEVDNRAAYKAIVRAIDQQFPEVSNTLVLLPEGGDGQFVNGLINNSVANIRAEPSSRTEMVTQALLGTPIRILKEENGWYLVQTPNGYLGWVNDFETQSLDKAELASFKDARKVVYAEQYGLAYTAPDETSMPVSDLVIGCILRVISSADGFHQVSYPDGRIAWVKKAEVRDAAEIFYQALQVEQLVKTALKFNGIPYLWGGVSSKAIDCSGLSSNVYFMNGILLPRDASQQALCGKEITTDYEHKELMTGDLLFFGRKGTATQPEKVTHVAIYLGDSEFIHAAGYRDRVSINSIDSIRENFIPDYPETFVRAVRMTGEDDDGFQPITENDFYKEIISITE